MIPTPAAWADFLLHDEIARRLVTAINWNDEHPACTSRIEEDLIDLALVDPDIREALAILWALHALKADKDLIHAWRDEADSLIAQMAGEYFESKAYHLR